MVENLVWLWYYGCKYNHSIGGDMKVCFIGHREVGYNFSREQLKEIIETKIKDGYLSFMVGCHGQFDTIALNVCRELRRTYQNISIEVVLTSLHIIQKKLVYEDDYGEDYFEQYKDVSTIMYDIEDVYFKNRIILSNKKMINSCDVLICYVDGKKKDSGAKRMMDYAIKKGLKIINLY